VKPELEALVRYQETIREEKRLLLEHDKAKEAIGRGIQTILDRALLRSVKRETLRMIVAGIEDEARGGRRREEWREAVLSIFLPLETWSQAREAVSDNTRIRQLGQKTAKLRNIILEGYIPLLRATRMAYLGDAPESMWDDLENEGFIGMIRGLDTMDLSKGQGLNEHLQAWALSMMLRYLRGTEYAKARKAAGSLNQKQGLVEKETKETKVPKHLGRRVRGTVGDGEEIELDESPLIPIDAGFSEAIAESGNFLERLMDQEDRATVFRMMIERTKSYSPLSAAIIRLHCAELVATEEKTGIVMEPEEAFEKMRELAAVNLIQGLESEGNDAH
jgi:hypothetical protein